MEVLRAATYEFIDEPRAKTANPAGTMQRARVASPSLTVNVGGS